MPSASARATFYRVEHDGVPTAKWATLPVEGEKKDGASRRAPAHLIVKRANAKEVEIPIERAEFVIGRLASEVDLALDDELVSRRHARLTSDPRGYYQLEDLGSRNAIEYAGRRVRRLNLVDGDRFAIGTTEFAFHADMPRFRRDSTETAPADHDPAMDEVEVPSPSTDSDTDD